MNIPLTSEQQALADKLLREVGSGRCRAVSFRMTGTLIVFPFSQYEDIFAFMEEDFRDVYRGKGTFTDLRIAAEDEACEKNTDKCAVTLDKVYDILMKRAKLSSSIRDKLEERECELAEFFAMPRGLGKTLFDEARRKNKKAIIVADTIYPQKTVENILKKCGYPCGNIIFANELSRGISENEAIFAAILEKGHVSPDKLLHIGGNVEADVELPIMKGAKALLLTNSNQLMTKSGRLRGYVQAKLALDLSPEDHIALRCAMGLCSAYLFDVPLHKLPQSDFCGSPYILGFTVWGCSQLIKAYQPESELLRKIVSAFAADPEISRGMKEFLEVYKEHFGDLLVKFGYGGCDIPLRFLEAHSASGDRNLLAANMNSADIEAWGRLTVEPSLAPVTERRQKRNSAAKLADKLFPPGTKVRNIADGMLVKIKSRGKI